MKTHDELNDLFATIQEGKKQAIELNPGKGLRGRRPKLTREARIAHAPHSPEELVDALQDPIHSLSGRSRVARSVRVRGDSLEESESAD